ncbi:hypothetical protein E4U41_003744, partial [Claviceps citrina]
MAAEVDPTEVFEMLVLAPFRDIVAKAQNAASNAAAAAAAPEPRMHKAAESLGREGQRALNRLDPLCRKIARQHGADCAAAVERNEDISRVHLELTGMLWEFDDYLPVEAFDEARYTELQALCRRLAPMMYNTLVRMNIELLAQASSSSSSSSSSAASMSSSSAPNKGTRLLHTAPGSSPPASPVLSVSSSAVVAAAAAADAWRHYPSLPHRFVGDVSWAENDSNNSNIVSSPQAAAGVGSQDIVCSPTTPASDSAAPQAFVERVESHSSGRCSPPSSPSSSLTSPSSRRCHLAPAPLSLRSIRERHDDRPPRPASQLWSSSSSQQPVPALPGRLRVYDLEGLQRPLQHA